jgi:bacterioferritin-associated ferredoxin
MHAQHVLAGAQRLAAQHAQPRPRAGRARESVEVADQRGRRRGETCIKARRRRCQRHTSLREITRMLGVGSGCLWHGCCKVRMQPIVMNAILKTFAA